MVMSMGVWKGVGAGGLWPLLQFDIWHFCIKDFAKKGCFVCFDWAK